MLIPLHRFNRFAFSLRERFSLRRAPYCRIDCVYHLVRSLGILDLDFVKGMASYTYAYGTGGLVNLAEVWP